MKNAHTASDFRPDINGLRAIAVAAVVAFHFDLPGFSGGFLGVDVFFVISGFLMTKIIVSRLMADRFSVGDFWLSRARRIVPALAVLCGFLLLLGWVSIDPIDYQKLALHAASSLTFLSNFEFWQEVGYFDAAAHEKWLLHTWSLSVEWQFYILLPLGLVATWKIFRSYRSLVVAISIALLLSLAASVVGSGLRPAAAYYLLPTRAWEMMAGGLTFLCSGRVALGSVAAKLVERAGIGLIVAGIVCLDSHDVWPGYLALVPVGGTVLVILANNASSVLTGNRVSQFIGETSYSIYLWHWPVVVAFGLEGRTGPVWIASGIALSVLLGYLSFRFVETPSRRMASKHSKLKESLGYAGGTAALLCLAVLVYRDHGLPSRLKADQARYVEAAAAAGDWGHPGAGCEVGLYFTSCYSQGASAEQIMFIGDSLAEQWYPRYGHPAPGRHYSTLFFTRGNCLPIRGVEGRLPGANCVEFASAAWAKVFKRKPQKLVISSIWLTYFFASSGAMRDGVCLVDSAGCVRVSDHEQMARVFDRLEQDVRRAVAAGIEVYIVGPTPQSGIDYPKAVRAELALKNLPLPIVRLRPSERPTATFANDRGLYSQGVIADFLSAVAVRTGAVLIMPERYMCPEGVCSNVDSSGRPIFKDRGHLRKSYVQTDAVSWMDRAIGVVQ